MDSISLTKPAMLVPALPLTVLAQAACPQGDAASRSDFLQHFDTAIADSARREIDDPQERAVVIRIRGQPQIR